MLNTAGEAGEAGEAGDAGLPLVDVWTYIAPKKSLNTSKTQRRTYDYVLILKPGVSVRRELLPWRNSAVTAQHSTIFTGLVLGPTRKLHQIRLCQCLMLTQ